MKNEITLSPLPYAEDALAPVVSARTVAFHFGKHHAGYVGTLNKLIEGSRYEGMSLEEIIASSREAGDESVFNNAAQTWNHDFYWRSLAPAGKGELPSGELLRAMKESFGSFEACRKALADSAIKRFGSGWAWLLAKDGKLVVESTRNAETPVGRPGVRPIVVVDVWEHAYYLDWQNARAAYVNALVDGLLDWSVASSRFSG